MSFLDRVKRRAKLIGGPFNGSDSSMPLPEDMPWPRFTCRRDRTAMRSWHHYTHTTDGTYRYAGLCKEIDHDGFGPHDHCERQWTAGQFSDHRCGLEADHDGDCVCQCCGEAAS